MLERSPHIAREARSGLLDLVSYLPDDILTKVDRASMAVGLEGRAPLLDHRIVEFALGLPLRLKRRGRDTKWLLRKLLLQARSPGDHRSPENGIRVPLVAWFRGPLRERMDDAIGGDDLQELGLDSAPIRTMWAEFKDGRSHRPDLFWQVFVLVSWSRQCSAARSAA